jgi:hypothetical protein
MADIFNLTDTWNDGGTTFTAIKMNVTDTASAAGSLVLDLHVGGVSKFSVDKNGDILFGRSGQARIYFNGSNIFLGAGEGVIIYGAVALGGDAYLTRHAAGVVKVSDGGSGGVIQTPALTVATLPAAATAGAGARSFVTDANATTFLSTVAGGGANKVPVVSDGTNWLIG